MASVRLDDELWAEALKVRRSTVPVLSTLAAFAIGTILGFHFFWVLEDPSRAGILGAPLASKDSVAWGRYSIVAACIAAGVGCVFFAIVVAWLLRQLKRRPPVTRAAVEAIVIIALRWSLFEVAKVVGIGLGFGVLLLLGALLPGSNGRS